MSDHPTDAEIAKDKPSQRHGPDDLGWLVDIVQEGVTTDTGGRLHPNNCRRAKIALESERAENAWMRAHVRATDRFVEEAQAALNYECLDGLESVADGIGLRLDEGWRWRNEAARLRTLLEVAQNAAIADRSAVDGLVRERDEALAIMLGAHPSDVVEVDLVEQCERLVGAEVSAEEASEALEGRTDFEPGAVIALAVVALVEERDRALALLRRALGHVEPPTPGRPPGLHAEIVALLDAQGDGGEG